MDSTLEYWIKWRFNELKVASIIRQIAEQLGDMHSSGNVHGNLYPGCIKLNLTGTEQVISIIPASELVKEPYSEQDESLSGKEGDIFNLGCLLYILLSGGQHPFGRSEYRQQLVNNNLYNLNDLKEEYLKDFIRKMIHHEKKERPKLEDLKILHPMFWSDEEISVYLIKKAKKICENVHLFEELSEITLFPVVAQNELTGLLTVAEIMKKIHENHTNAIDWYNAYPDLLKSIYFNIREEDSEDLSLRQVGDKIVNSGNVGNNLDDEKNKNDDGGDGTGIEPEVIGSLLIAGNAFKELDPAGIPRQHGRLGGQYVHVFQVQEDVDRETLKNMRYLKHPHLLTIIFLVENPSKWLMAVEPFQATLNTWNETTHHNIESIKDIMTQTIEALSYLHSKDVVHGSLSANQIVIFQSKSKTVAKIAKFPASQFKKQSKNETPLTKENDIRNIGHVYKELLKELDSQESEHLIKSMTDPVDAHLPPSDAVIYHPFFWSDEESVDFRQTASQFISECNIRSFDEYGELEKLPIIQIWLILQQLKDIDVIESYYHTIYNYPTYDDVKTNRPVITISDGGEQENQLLLNNEVDRERRSKIPASDLALPSLSDYLNTSCQQNIFGQYLEKYINKLKQVSEYQLDAVPVNCPIDAFGRTALHLASHSDEFIDSATQLLENFKFNPNHPDASGYVPLHFAILSSSYEIAKLLVKHFADVNIVTRPEVLTPLFLSIVNNSMEIAQLLLKKSANIRKVDSFGRNALHIAVATRAFKLVGSLLKDYFFDVNATDNGGNSALHIAVGKNDIDMVHILLTEYRADPNVTDDKISSAIHLAVANKNLQIVELLLKCGANPNLTDLDGNSLLHVIAEHDKGFAEQQSDTSRIVDLLINKYEMNTNAFNRHGYSILHVATFFKSKFVVARLLECTDTIVDTKDLENNLAPLHLAAYFNFEDIAQMLIKKGADVNGVDSNNNSPLGYAASRNSFQVAKLLLDAGATVKVKSSQALKVRTPLHIAAAQNAQQVASLLIEKGGNINARDELDLTPIHYASFCHKPEFIRFLQERVPTGKKHRPDWKPRSDHRFSPDDLAQLQQLTSLQEFQHSLSISTVQVQFVLNINSPLPQNILMFPIICR